MYKNLLILLPLLTQIVHAAENCQNLPHCDIRGALRIEESVQNTIFERIGLQKGDILLRINGQELTETNLPSLIKMERGSDPLNLKFIRPASPSLSGELEINLQTGRPRDMTGEGFSEGGGRITPREKFSREGDESGDRLPGRTISGGDRSDVIGGLIEALGGRIPKETGPRGGDIGVIELPDRPSRPDRPETGGPSTPDEPSAPNEPIVDEPQSPSEPDSPEEPDAPNEPEPSTPEPAGTPEGPKDDDGGSGGNGGGNDPEPDTTDDDDDGPTPDPDDDFRGRPDDPNPVNDTNGIRGGLRKNVFRKVTRTELDPWINPKRGESMLERIEKSKELKIDLERENMFRPQDRIRINPMGERFKPGGRFQ